MVALGWCPPRYIRYLLDSVNFSRPTESFELVLGATVLMGKPCHALVPVATKYIHFHACFLAEAVHLGMSFFVLCQHTHRQRKEGAKGACEGQGTASKVKISEI